MNSNNITKLLAYYIWLQTNNEDSLYNWTKAEKLVQLFPSINETIINEITTKKGYTFDKCSIEQYFTDECPVCFEVKVLTNFQCDHRHRACQQCILDSYSLTMHPIVKCFFCRFESLI